MKVIVPIAGEGTRLRPHTLKRPKCLLPVAGKPVLDHILDPLVRSGLRDITLVTGGADERVRSHLEQRGLKVDFALQAEPLGLGHAVFQALSPSDEPALIQLGDVIFDVDFSHFTHPTAHLVAVAEVPDPERFGIVEVEGSRIVAVHEKPSSPPTNLAIVGLYFLSRQKPLWDAIDFLMRRDLTTRGEIQLADALEWMIRAGERVEYRTVDRWWDCGVHDTILSTNRVLLKPLGACVNGAEIIEPVHIGRDCVISGSVIGPHATVMDGCTIRSSRVTDAIVLWGAELNGVRVEHEIVGEGERR